MIALQNLGLAIVLNAWIFAVGMIRSKRQVKRVAAERAAERRSFYKLEPLPPPGDEVLVLVEDGDDGRTSELTAVHWPHLGWTDAVTLLRVEGDVLGWRSHPFLRPPQEDPETWSRDRLKAELAKLNRDERS